MKQAFIVAMMFVAAMAVLFACSGSLGFITTQL